jgi:hypothetical protein
MAVNQKYDRADSLSMPVANGTLAGVPVFVGSLAGTTRTPEGEGVGNAEGFATVDFVGAYEFTVTGALTPGAPVYRVTADGTLNAAATGAVLWGYALTTKGSGSGLATVRPARI